MLTVPRFFGMVYCKSASVKKCRVASHENGTFLLFAPPPSLSSSFARFGYTGNSNTVHLPAHRLIKPLIFVQLPSTTRSLSLLQRIFRLGQRLKHLMGACFLRVESDLAPLARIMLERGSGKALVVYGGYLMVVKADTWIDSEKEGQGHTLHKHATSYSVCQLHHARCGNIIVSSNFRAPAPLRRR